MFNLEKKYKQEWEGQYMHF